jgi:putative PIN family toxin of toxin-antitoxin system
VLKTIVVDANILVAGFISATGYNRAVLRACLQGLAQPIIGEALFLEYESVMSRSHLYVKSPLSSEERKELFAAFLSVCEWVSVYYLWRPNLRDEGDNHVLELAVAGGAEFIVTNNLKDFTKSELRFPEIGILTPKEFLNAI